ncbi:peptide/nickel transport system permease protein [Nonomuraea angiospora]|uniref:Peptide/nickel transport system permease protein n=1 Tax=Nonomuraea angiospora TaxID=46172 RepID=A0ABR9LVM6_9ACTN|nr:peptide/nickel transport system permease protein [Nonomuraea angiospora]
MIAAVMLLFVVSITTFAIFFLVPRLAGMSADDLASRYVGKAANEQVIHDTAIRLGFYDPLLVQYGRFVKGIFVGVERNYGPGVELCPAPCLGYSYVTQNPVLPDLLDRIPITLSLALGAAVVWVVFGVATGVVSALRRGSFFDRISMGVALAGVSLPIFFTGIVSLAIFRDQLGLVGDVADWVPFSEDPLTWANNLMLPWITLAFLYAAGYARLTRAGMLETMSEDYIRTARAKGLPERAVVLKHGLRATLTPVLTMFGLDLGLLLGGAVLTESTFSLPGIGKYARDAIERNDLPQVMGVTLVAAVFIIVANLIVDLLYAVVDPRVRLA